MEQGEGKERKIYAKPRDVFIEIKFIFGQMESNGSSEVWSKDELKSNWSLNEGKNDDCETVRNVDLIFSSCGNGNDRWWANFGATVPALFDKEEDEELFNFTHLEHSWLASIISVIEQNSLSKSFSSISDVWPVLAAIWLSISIRAASTFSGRPAISNTGSLSRPGVTM